LFESESFKKRFAWLGRRVLKLVISYILCFAAATIIYIIVNPSAYGFADYLWNLVSLKMPGTSTWYFKIQLLFYIILWIVSCFCKKKAGLWVGLLSVVYIAVAVIVGLEEYWWKTAMCFAAGLAVGEYKDKIAVFTEKHRLIAFIIAVAVALVVYAYLFLAPFGFQPVLHNIAYCLLAMGICIAVIELRPLTKTAFHWFSRFTLELYLMHIGILKVFVYENCAWWSIGLYILLSIIISWLINKVVAALDKRITTGCLKRNKINE